MTTPTFDLTPSVGHDEWQYFRVCRTGRAHVARGRGVRASYPEAALRDHLGERATQHATKKKHFSLDPVLA